MRTSNFEALDSRLRGNDGIGAGLLHLAQCPLVITLYSAISIDNNAGLQVAPY
ncbi:MAG: hypothetical protein WCX90_00715 [Thiohalomonadaceae bacterium]